MPAQVPPTSRDPHQSGVGSIVGGIGASVLVIVCCAAPVLLAAGALGAVGAWLSNPWVIAAAVTIASVATVAIVAQGRVAHTRRAACRPAAPPARPSDPERSMTEDPRQQ